MELDGFKNNIDVQLEDELYALVTVLWSSTTGYIAGDMILLWPCFPDFSVPFNSLDKEICELSAEVEVKQSVSSYNLKFFDFKAFEAALLELSNS